MRDWLIGLGLSESLILILTSYAVKVLGALVVLTLALIVSGWVRGLVLKSLKRAHFDETLTRFFGTTARWLVLLLAVLGCLGIFGIETTSFAAVLGGASLAIGLAFQGSLSNVAAGVMLLAFRPFKVGQVVTVANQTGTIEEIGLFTTTMNTPDRRHIIIPNGQVFGATIVNITHSPTRRVDVAVGVGYGEDIDRTREVLRAAAMGVTPQLPEEPAVVVLVGLGPSSVDWQVRVFCRTEDFALTSEAVIRAIKYALDEAGIEIPFPQRVIHTAQAAKKLP